MSKVDRVIQIANCEPGWYAVFGDGPGVYPQHYCRVMGMAVTEGGAVFAMVGSYEEGIVFADDYANYMGLRFLEAEHRHEFSKESEDDEGRPFFHMVDARG